VNTKIIPGLEELPARSKRCRENPMLVGNQIFLERHILGEFRSRPFK